MDFEYPYDKGDIKWITLVDEMLLIKFFMNLYGEYLSSKKCATRA